jgi:hypothetical protein
MSATCLTHDNIIDLNTIILTDNLTYKIAACIKRGYT